jgi:hypothetical protein
MRYEIEYLDSFHSPRVKYNGDLFDMWEELYDLLIGGKSVAIHAIEEGDGFER